MDAADIQILCGLAVAAAAAAAEEEEEDNQTDSETEKRPHKAQTKTHSPMLDERIGPNRTGAGYVIRQGGQSGAQMGSRLTQEPGEEGEARRPGGQEGTGQGGGGGGGRWKMGGHYLVIVVNLPLMRDDEPSSR